MSYYEPQTAKKVYLYRNGTVNKDAKLLVVNDRQVRDFGTFLNRVTSGIRAPVAVRNIYTPAQGHKVRSLEELVSGKYYVAGGSEQFKRVKYGSGPRLLPRRQQRVEVSVPQCVHTVVVAEARYKRPVEKPLVIHVFRNGDELFHGVRVLLPRRVMASWDHVLEIVTDKADLCTPAKKLCTLDGEVVTELQDAGKYVAVEGGRGFRRVAYCATNLAAARRRRNVALTQPIVTRRWTKQPSRTLPSLPPPLTNTLPMARPQPPPVDPVSRLIVPQRRKLRPMAGRRNKEARERALLENRDDSVFGGSPVMQTHARMPSPPPSVSTASLLQRSLRQPASESRQSIKGHSEWGQSHPAAGSAAFASPSKDDDIVSGYNSSRQVTEGDSGGRSKEGGVVYMPGSSGGNSDTESLGVRQGSGIPVNSVQEDVDIPTAVVAVPHVHGVVREGREGGAIEEQQGRNIPTESDREEEEERKKEAGGRDGEGGREREDAVSSGENTGAEDTVEGVEEEAGLGVELEGGGSDSRIKMDTIQEEEEVVRNVDQVEPDEVPEEEGMTERSKVKDTEAVEMEVLPQDIELEARPAQTTVDLTMSRRQQQLTNESNTAATLNGSNTSDDVGRGEGVGVEDGDTPSTDVSGDQEHPSPQAPQSPSHQTTPPPSEHVLIVEDSPQ